MYSSGGLTALCSACAGKSTTLRIFVLFQDIVLQKGRVLISYQDRKQQLTVKMSSDLLFEGEQNLFFWTKRLQ